MPDVVPKDVLHDNVVLVVGKDGASPGGSLPIGDGGGALALRMNMVLDSDVPTVVRAMRGLIRQIGGMASPPDTWKKLARFLEAILRNEKVPASGAQEDISFLSTPLDTGDTHLDSQIKAAVTAWGGNQYGRYCAEPKGYAAARRLFIDSRIVRDGPTLAEKSISWSWVSGQLAFWHAANGETFRIRPVIGADDAPGVAGNGAYMVPCESCKNRSAEMIIGI